MRDLLHETAERASAYLNGLADRPVAPRTEDLAGLAAFDQELPQQPTDPAEVLALLDDLGSPGTVASAGPRYFGFVTG
ncbi:MAG TPA: aspartate aminotransferase family protein, partial [Chloroflexota bacterium]|nr:aspartate aminotransferase family protein [Chloroflexota bacterium]